MLAAVIAEEVRLISAACIVCNPPLFVSFSVTFGAVVYPNKTGVVAPVILIVLLSVAVELTLTEIIKYPLLPAAIALLMLIEYSCGAAKFATEPPRYEAPEITGEVALK